MTQLEFGSSYTRRLPIYLLLGVGDSMAGPPIQALQEGVGSLQQMLLSDAQTAETVWLSVITFADVAVQAAPLAEIMRFTPPVLTAGGRCSLGAGLRMLLRCIERDTIRPTPQQKGDYKPLVFLVVDNEPSDSWERELAALDKARRAGLLGNLIAIGVGPQVNPAVLRFLSESVLVGDQLTWPSLRSLIVWTSASVRSASQTALTAASGNITLPEAPREYEVVL